jgi:hypothetical protein
MAEHEDLDKARVEGIAYAVGDKIIERVEKWVRDQMIIKCSMCPTAKAVADANAQFKGARVVAAGVAAVISFMMCAVGYAVSAIVGHYWK